MSFPVVFEPDAQAEFDGAFDYYEGRRSMLGDKFVDAVRAVLDRISHLPQLHPAVFGNTRRAVVKGFPYCIYYREEPSAVRILSVFHARRDPSVWQSRG